MTKEMDEFIAVLEGLSADIVARHLSGDAARTVLRNIWPDATDEEMAAVFPHIVAAEAVE